VAALPGPSQSRFARCPAETTKHRPAAGRPPNEFSGRINPETAFNIGSGWSVCKCFEERKQRECFQGDRLR
jgi:hypothetical protein